jgi:uncharacterized protein (UPF0332 family)
LNNGLKTKVLFEISQIDKLLDASKPLFDLCKLKEPDFIEMSACAMVLHSFYNGIENILILIFKHYDEKLPHSIRWHMELLDKAFIPEKDRDQIFENELQKTLEEYLKFRHFVRHSYGFQLEWERMENLINEISIFWKNIKDNINNFLESS